MKERILEFLRYENKTSAQFAEEIGVQASSISHIISGRNNPSLDFVMKMLQKYPSLSTDWLLFGSGGMFRDQPVNDLFGSAIVDENFSKDISEKRQEGITGYPKQGERTESAAGSVRKASAVAGMAKRVFIIYDDDTFKEYLPGLE